MAYPSFSAAVSTVENAARCALRGGRFRGVEPSHGDAQMILDAYTMLGLVAYDLSPELQKDMRWVGRLFTQVGDSADKLSLLDALRSLDDAVLDIFQTQADPTQSHFKGALGEYWRFVAPVAVPLLRTSATQAEALGKLHQFASFPLRTTLRESYGASPASERFLANEQVVQGLHATSGLEPFFNRFCSRTPPVFDDVQPRHGNGAVWDAKRSLVSKYDALGTDPRVHQLCLRTGWPEFSGSFVRMSKFQEVPKSYEKRRGICLESATLQFYQQGVFRVILDAISRSDLARHIDLMHPEYNDYCALEGSISGRLATIDLSDASDLIPWDLVKQSTWGTWLYPLLLFTRSSKVDLEGTVVDVAKFAAMGAATTFVVECLVFAAITETAAVRAGARRHELTWRVYGDDIIVETKYYDAVISELQRYGFKVNTKKSYCSTGPYTFRESCGGEYLNGVDITPIRISRMWKGWDAKVNPCWFENAIELSNACYWHKLKTLRRYLIGRLNRLPRRMRPLFTNEYDNGLFTPNVTGYSNYTFWAHDYQKLMVVHGAAKAERKPIQRDDDKWLLWEALRSSRDRTSLLDPDDLVTLEPDILLRKLKPIVRKSDLLLQE